MTVTKDGRERRHSMPPTIDEEVIIWDVLARTHCCASVVSEMEDLSLDSKPVEGRLVSREGCLLGSRARTTILDNEQGPLIYACGWFSILAYA